MIPIACIFKNLMYFVLDYLSMKLQRRNGPILDVSFTAEPSYHRQKGGEGSVWKDIKFKLSVGCFPYHTDIRNNFHFWRAHECRKCWKSSRRIQSCQMYYSDTSIHFLHWWVVCSNQLAGQNIHVMSEVFTKTSRMQVNPLSAIQLMYT